MYWWGFWVVQLIELEALLNAAALVQPDRGLYIEGEAGSFEVGRLKDNLGSSLVKWENKTQAVERLQAYLVEARSHLKTDQ